VHCGPLGAGHTGPAVLAIVCIATPKKMLQNDHRMSPGFELDDVSATTVQVSNYNRIIYRCHILRIFAHLRGGGKMVCHILRNALVVMGGIFHQQLEQLGRWRERTRGIPQTEDFC